MQENEQSRAWDSGGPDERDGGHAGACDGAEEPGGAVPRLGACCPGMGVKIIRNSPTKLLFYPEQWSTHPEPCHVRCTWPLSLRRGDKVTRP